MTTIRVSITTTLEVDVEEWVAAYEHHEDEGTTPEEVATAIFAHFKMTDQVPRWARDAVQVIEDHSNHVGTAP